MLLGDGMVAKHAKEIRSNLLMLMNLRELSCEINIVVNRISIITKKKHTHTFPIAYRPTINGGLI